MIRRTLFAKTAAPFFFGMALLGCGSNDAVVTGDNGGDASLESGSSKDGETRSDAEAGRGGDASPRAR